MMSVAEGTGHYLDTALQLAKEFAKTAIERDERGGTAKAERDLLRKSGLLSLIIPKSLGGLGKDWKAVLQITRELAKVDGSLAHLFGYHFLCLTSVHLFGSPQQKEKYYKETAENNLFWGNTYNPLDESLLVKREGDQLKLIGKKAFARVLKIQSGCLYQLKVQIKIALLLLLFLLIGQE